MPRNRIRSFPMTFLRAAVAGICVLSVSVLAVREFRVSAKEEPDRITIDYPLNGSVFPPDMASPTFLWRDPTQAADSWRIDVAFDNGSPALHLESKGERMRIGEIDPRCISPNNKLPELTPEQAAAHTWKPDAATWAAIRSRRAGGSVTISIRGYSRGNPKVTVSKGEMQMRMSADRVNAPIFYRDVPLMPSETEKGFIKPLAPDRGSVDRLADSQRGRIQQSRSDDGSAYLRQLPFFLGQRQDAGPRHGRAAKRQGPVRAGARREENDDREPGTWFRGPHFAVKKAASYASASCRRCRRMAVTS